MRVLRSTLDGSELEGEVIGGDHCDEVSGEIDLTETFTVRTDQGAVSQFMARVLERDGYRCRVCDASGRDKRSIIVHHRVPGKSVLHLRISLCPACHAKVHRTRAIVRLMPPLLLELWREVHPKGHEQTPLNFLTHQVNRHCYKPLHHGVAHEALWEPML